MHVCPSEKCGISNTEVSLTSQMAQLYIGQRFWLITLFWSLIALKYGACSDKTSRTLLGRLQGSSSSVSLLWQRLLVLQQPTLYQQASQQSNLNLMIQTQRDKVPPLPSSYTLPLLSLLWSCNSSIHKWEGSETSDKAEWFLQECACFYNIVLSPYNYCLYEARWLELQVADRKVQAARLRKQQPALHQLTHILKLHLQQVRKCHMFILADFFRRLW